MSEKLKLVSPVIVEGKYDKIKLSSIIESEIICLNGFGIFKDEKKREMLKKIANEHGLIVLTDSDGGGLVIRNHLRALIPSHQLTHLYIPKIKGKEKRKDEASKEGLLGVEGMDTSILRELFEPFLVQKTQKNARKVTKTDLFCDGLLGNSGSVEKRKKLCAKCSLPDNISTNALIEAINLLFGYDRYKEIINEIEK
ncbi:MAG: DUF4093 domain-containing protein [Clostridia bacterium]|nr:DUF4093 domain-containing protein [Clostridia bacterium]